MAKNPLISAIKKIEAEKPIVPCSWFDSGSYVLNALLSANIYRGYKTNCLYHLAAESSVGKSLLALEACISFLKTFPEAVVFYIDTELAMDQASVDERVPEELRDRFFLTQRNEINDVLHTAVTITSKIECVEKKEEDVTEEDKEPKLMFVIDSLNRLRTKKSVEDALKGADKKDMTKVQETNKLLNTIAGECATKNIPLITTGWVYEQIGSMTRELAVSGGRGVTYNSDMLLTMTKSKFKDNSGDIKGSLIRTKVKKGRLAKENQVAVLRNLYEKGFDRWYGMLELAQVAGAIVPEGRSFVFMHTGEKVAKKKIEENYGEYFDVDVLDKINEYVKSNFSYGKNDEEGVFDMEEEIDNNIKGLIETIDKEMKK